MDLQDLGWDAFFADAFAPHEADGLIPARVAARHHGPCELLTAQGRRGGVPAGRLTEAELPAVGDWVAARPLDGERKAVKPDPAAALAEVEAVALGVPVIAVSAARGEGLDALAPYLGRGRTVALLGSSGVGKTTLANRLLGSGRLATGATSAGGKGRHTTTRRDLIPLPGGAMLLDTPGMRELQLWADEEALDSTFPEVAELESACRFGDCSHDGEPGCAVRRALDEGTLTRERFDAWRKLQRELRALEVRRDARLRADRKREVKAIERNLRRHYGH